MVLNVLWFILDVENVENLELITKLIFVHIVAIELQGLLNHMSEIIKSERITLEIIQNPAIASKRNPPIARTYLHINQTPKH